MTLPTIRIHTSWLHSGFLNAKEGAVFTVVLDGLRWPLEVRQRPPRVRLLEDGKGRPTPVLCELLDPWPDAPAYYPPEWAPGAPPSPKGSLYEQCPVPGW